VNECMNALIFNVSSLSRREILKFKNGWGGGGGGVQHGGIANLIQNASTKSKKIRLPGIRHFERRGF
jgi:hypothetical protein